MAIRSDAARSREAIIDTAIALLRDDPDVTLQAIADAAAVSRMTLYRHFPNREALVLAVAERVAGGLDAVLARMAEEDRTLDDALGQLVDFTIATALEHRALIEPATLELAAQAAVEGEPILPVLAGWRARGVMRDDLDLLWLALVIRGTLLAGVRRLLDPAMDPALVRTQVSTTLLAMLRPPPG